VISGRTADREGLRRQFDRWEQELRPGAVGFLGSTGGLTDDGRFIAVARFASVVAARRTSARDEQGAWWAEKEKYIEDVSFQESVDVTTMLGGGSNDARFVQIMRGRVTNALKMAEINARTSEFEAMMSRLRPDILGDVIAMHPDGTYTDVVYFTSEKTAREGESREIPADAQAMFEDLMSSIIIDEYLDLKDPWLR
jgi:hypothetical protein